MTGSPDAGPVEAAIGPHSRTAPVASVPAPARLKRRAEFLAAARGRRAHARCFSVQILQRRDAEPDGARFGLTVTKKTGIAVERNRIRRRLREALRTPGLASEPGHDYVIVARRDALTVPFTTLVAELSKTLARAREAGSQPRGRRKPQADPAGSGLSASTPVGASFETVGSSEPLDDRMQQRDAS